MFTAPSALHVMNLASLMWLREECRHDPGHAAHLFDIKAETALFCRELSDGAIEALCGELDLSLFLPRFDSKALASAVTESRQASGELHASALALHNLGTLEALHDACRRSSADAVWVYRINQETAEAYRALDHFDVVAMCTKLTVSAFVPRYDAAEMARLLDKPAGLRALYAAAYETDIAAANAAARRSVYLAH